jgi:hypothetical protein
MTRRRRYSLLDAIRSVQEVDPGPPAPEPESPGQYLQERVREKSRPGELAHRIGAGQAALRLAEGLGWPAAPPFGITEGGEDEWDARLLGASPEMEEAVEAWLGKLLADRRDEVAWWALNEGYPGCVLGTGEIIEGERGWDLFLGRATPAELTSLITALGIGRDADG